MQRAGVALCGANDAICGRRPAGGNDGILSAEEVARLDLSGCRLAVISACESGLGEACVGEGVLGLRRAFRVAGARTLITSLWPVEDEAAREWMRGLYRAKWGDGMRTAESVREASLRMLQRRRSRGQSTHPFYWAGFVASGDWR